MPSPGADAAAAVGSPVHDHDAAVSRAANRLDPEAFQRWYGTWQPWSPTRVLDRFGDAPFRWWIVGGWSTDFGQPPRREHEDTDVSVLADDLPALRQWLRGFHLWEAHQGTLRPLLPDLPLTPGRQQLWLRYGASSPWLLDLALTPSDRGVWLYKRDPRLRLPLDEVVVTGPDGVPYQRPEITLLFKARLSRAKDEADLLAVLPTLDVTARAWLHDALNLTEPGHPWLAQVVP